MTGHVLALLLGAAPGPCPASADALERSQDWGIQQVAVCIESKETPQSEATSRWLATKRMDRLDQGITDIEARAYTPSSLRLLIDAIHAHRGRKSPSPDHEEILTSFPWYSPNAGYTDQRLNALDRENLTKLKHPPTIPISANPSRNPQVRETRGCFGGYGCTTTGAPIPLLWWLSSTLLVISRRRAGERPSAEKRRVAGLHQG